LSIRAQIADRFILGKKDRKFNPALFAPLADGDGLALITRGRALRREHVAPAPGGSARPVRSRWRRFNYGFNIWVAVRQFRGYHTNGTDPVLGTFTFRVQAGRTILASEAIQPQ